MMARGPITRRVIAGPAASSARWPSSPAATAVSAIVFLEENQDARDTAAGIEAEGRQSLMIRGDVRDEAFCLRAVELTIERLDRLQVLVNNADEPHPRSQLSKITAEQLARTFRTNVFGYYFMTKAALFTRSLAQALAEKTIRVNAVAPGPIWTPLIPASFSADEIPQFGKKVPLGRPGQPNEVAPCLRRLLLHDRPGAAPERRRDRRRLTRQPRPPAAVRRAV